MTITDQRHSPNFHPPHFTNFKERQAYRRTNHRQAVARHGARIVQEARRLRRLYGGKIHQITNDEVFNLAVIGTGIPPREGRNR